MVTAELSDKKPAPRVDTKGLLKFYDALKARRTPWEQLWQDCAQFIVPRKYPGMGATITTPTTEDADRLFDTTAITAHQINAAGCLQWMTPETSPWFNYGVPVRVKDQAAKKYLAEVSQTGRELIAQSTFYLAAHEMYLDRGGFGTGCVYAERDYETGKLHFECWALGTFVIAEDHRKNVNTVVRCFKLSALQAEEKFGRENLPEKMRKCLEKGGDKALDEFEFLHFIMPRSTAAQQTGGNPKEKMPWACYYIAKDGSHLCKESGYRTKPFFVSRYLEWGTGLGWTYGWAPAFTALPDARQTNWLNRNMDALAELMAFPPWVAPADLEGDIDPNPGGVTYVDINWDQTKWPKQMPVTGRYDVGLDRIERKQKSIERAFHVDMFQMFTMMDKPPEMTAREIGAREAEKLIPFSPTFSRLKSEFTNPLIQWLFDEMLHFGDIGGVDEIPQTLIRQTDKGLYVADPVIQYLSRLEMSMQQLPTLGFYNVLDLCKVIAEGSQNPGVYDNFDTDKGVRNAALKYGVEAEIIRSETDVQQLRNARAEAQQAMEEAQMQMAGADMASKLGSVKSDSVVGKAIEQEAA